MKSFLQVLSNFYSKLPSNRRVSKLNSANESLIIKEEIDKSTAIDDSQTIGLLSNFYTIGDSLSDLGGLTSVFSMSLRREINVSEPSINNSYTNGDNAVMLVARYFKIKKFTAGFDYQTANNHFIKHGKNYAIAGATAAEISTGLSLMLNSFKLKDQARTLLKQHQIQTNDWVFIEIGGNDLFQIMELPREQQQAKLNEAISNIKETLVLLLDNGLSKIILANAPDISCLPKYLNTPLAKAAKRLSREFNQKLHQIFVKVNAEYDYPMEFYNLQNKFYEMLKQFKGNITDAPTVIKRDLRAVIKRCTIEIEINSDIKIDQLNNYFFFDEAHPTKWAHEQVAQDLINLIEKRYKK